MKYKYFMMHSGIILCALTWMAYDTIRVFSTAPIQYHVGAGNMSEVEEWVRINSDDISFEKNISIFLHIAIENESTEMLQYLFKAGANPLIPKDNTLPVYAAALKNNTEMVEIILDFIIQRQNGSHVNYDWTWNRIFMRENKEMFEAFIQRGIIPPESYWEDKNDREFYTYVRGRIAEVAESNCESSTSSVP